MLQLCTWFSTQLTPTLKTEIKFMYNHITWNVFLHQMFEEGSMWASWRTSTLHHQNGAVRPTVRPARHCLCHHVRSAGTVYWRISVCVSDREVVERKMTRRSEQDRCEMRLYKACFCVITVNLSIILSVSESWDKYLNSTFCCGAVEILSDMVVTSVQIYVVLHLSAFAPPSWCFRPRMCPVCLLESTAPLKTT